ncbi:hypothetical protein SDC9_119728 [bioreactor metagenome]|uniref:Uncharacterized protein n=1 Tax=bioreactor metagenome TaxID=1076179 RepID=A0A645C529_9ZZZZ
MFLILSNLIIQSTADTPCAIIVASATPATPILKPATNQMSRITLSTVAISKNTKEDTESPRPLKTPARML